MPVKPLWIVERAVTVFPLTHESLRDVCDQVVAVYILSAAGNFRMRVEQLSPDELQFAVEVMEVCMGDQLIRSSHGQKLTAPPQTLIIIKLLHGVPIPKMLLQMCRHVIIQLFHTLAFKHTGGPLACNHHVGETSFFHHDPR